MRNNEKAKKNQFMIDELSAESVKQTTAFITPPKRLNYDEIREFVFGSYAELIVFAKSKFYSLTQKGVSIEELVNEAVVGVFDAKIDFENTDVLLNFIKQSIKGIGYEEKELLKDNRFIIKQTALGKEYRTRKKPNLYLDKPSYEFTKMYLLFEKHRFNKENIFYCPKCGSEKYYNRVHYGKQKYECKSCRKIFSITSSTYIDSMKIPYSKLYKGITILCNDFKYSSYMLARKMEVTQKTAWARGHLIKSTITSIGCSKRSLVLSKLLTVEQLDKKPIVLLITNNQLRLKPEDISTIIRCRKENIYSAIELSKMFNVARRMINRIVRGELYKQYQTIPY